MLLTNIKVIINFYFIAVITSKSNVCKSHFLFSPFLLLKPVPCASVYFELDLTYKPLVMTRRQIFRIFCTPFRSTKRSPA